MQRNKIIIGIVILILLGAGVWYFQKPEKVVAQAMQRVAEAKTAHYTGLIKIENLSATQESLGEAGTVEVSLDGVYSRQDNKPTAVDTKVNLAAKTDSVGVQSDGEIKLIEDKIYVFLNKIPPTLAPLEPVKGQWLVFDRGVVPEANQTAAINWPFTQVKRKGTETIDGQTTVKYEAMLSPEGIIALTDGFNYQLRGNHLTPEQVTSLKESLANQSNLPVTLWIKQWSHQLKQIGVTSSAPNGAKVNMTMTIKELNQPVTITKPDNARNLQDILGSAEPEPEVSPTPTVSPTPSPRR